MILYNERAVGVCSICGGTVTVPSVWMGVIPPVPTCNRCRATQAEALPVLPMVPAPPPTRLVQVTESSSSTGGWIPFGNPPFRK
jgi:hypothetical protein